MNRSFALLAVLAAGCGGPPPPPSPAGLDCGGLAAAQARARAEGADASALIAAARAQACGLRVGAPSPGASATILATAPDTTPATTGQLTDIPSAADFPPVPGAGPLTEDSPFDFTPAQLAAFCRQDWSIRRGPDGRIEYNPCRNRDLFR